MIQFIIPVKSKKVTGSWGLFSQIFERTLKSVANQTSPNFRIVVVCHEKPEVDFNHPYVDYIHVDFDPPNLKGSPKELHDGLKEADKSRKILAGVEFSKKYNPDYCMVVDADDCISNKIAQFVETEKKNDRAGWYFKKGYIYREGDTLIALNMDNFNTLCGTCIIIKPELIKDVFKNVPHLLFVHKTTNLPKGITLAPLPFPGSIYSMANGENHYMTGDQIKNLTLSHIFSWSALKGFLRKLKKYRLKPLSGALKKEFGIYALSH